MKKIYLFLSLLFMFMGGSMNAQYSWNKFVSLGDAITDVSSLQDGSYYAFKNFGMNKYIKITNYETLQFGNDATLSEDDLSDGLAVFKLHVDNSGETPLYSFETAISGYYIPVVPGSSTSASTTQGKFQILTQNKKNETKDGYFTIKNNDNDVYFDMTGESFVGWGGDPGNQCWYQIIPVTISEADADKCIDYKNIVKKGDEVFSTTYSVANVNAEVTAPTVQNPFYYTLSSQPTDLTVTTSNYEFTYVYTKTSSLPFEFNKWSSLKIINQGTRFLHTVNEDNSCFVSSQKDSTLAQLATTYPDFEKLLWRVEEAGWGVKLYNKAIGKYLKVNGDGTDKSKRASFDDNGTVLYLKQNGDGYAFYTGEGNKYLNACCKGSTTGANSRLGVWDNTNSATDPGSRFYFDQTDETLLTLGKSAFAGTPDVTTYNASNALQKGGVYSAFNAEAAATTSLDDLLSVADDKVPNAVRPEAGVYYLVRNINGGEAGTAEDKNKYLTTEHIFCDSEGTLQQSVNNISNNRNILRTKGTAAILPRLWQFEETAENSNKFYLLNANLNLYATFADIATPANQSGKKSFTFETTSAVFGPAYKVTNDNSTMFLMIYEDNRMLNASNGMGSNNQGVEWSDVGSWNDKSDGGNHWQFVKVTEIPVSIGSTGYASIALPFAAQIPEDSNVKAYYASSANGNSLHLEEITSKQIPANTGVILCNEDGETTVNLQIINDAAAIEGNKLAATTAKRQGFTALTNYVLAATDNGAGFRIANITTVPANKAYLPKANVSTPEGTMRFVFGDDVTGIDNINAAQTTASKKYFDLQGRRVMYPSKGIYVTEDGQKVFLK